MNRKVSKRINKKAKEIAVEWLKSMLSEEESLKITAKNVPKSNPCAYKNGVAFSMPYSYRGAKRILKVLIRKGMNLNEITTHDLEAHVRSTQRF